MTGRRRRSSEPAIPASWKAILAERVALWADLDSTERARLESMVGDFVFHKRWEGVGGLMVTEEMRVVVAAHACVLVLALDPSVFKGVGSIVIYPRPVVSRRTRSLGGGIVAEGPLPIHGETRQGGPVVIVWSALDIESRRPELGRNVVYHEFAHQLDLHDGALDGMPPLSREIRSRWVEMRDAVYGEVLADGDPLLGSYAATNHGELFAVSTERFFTRPVELREAHSGWYELLTVAYGQDPAARVAGPDGDGKGSDSPGDGPSARLA